MAWQAQSLQAVLFPVPGAANQLDAFQVWERIFGKRPDAFNSLPGNPIATTQAKGPVQGMQMVVASQLGRIDLVLKPTAMADEIPALPSLDKAVNEMTAALQKMDAPSTYIRLGIIGSFFEVPTDDIATRISELIGINAFRSGSIDCLYQTNIPREFHFDSHMRMNRLISIAHEQIQFITAPNIASSLQSFASVQKIFDTINLKIDINQPPQDRPFASIKDILSEQMLEMSRIASAGLVGLYDD